MVRSFLALVCLLFAFSPLLAQRPDTTSANRTADTSVSITGEVEHPQIITLSDLMSLPLQSVQIENRDRTTITYEGALLADVLKLAGAPQGDKLRGRYLASFYLLVVGADSNGAIFALPEVDPSFTDRTILLAYRADGKPLSTKDGPLQIIVPSDKRHGRWVRQVVTISVAKVGS